MVSTTNIASLSNYFQHDINKIEMLETVNHANGKVYLAIRYNKNFSSLEYILWGILNRFVRNIMPISTVLLYASKQTSLVLIILRPISKCVTQRNGVHLYGNEDH